MESSVNQEGLQKLIDELFDFYFTVYPDAEKIPVQVNLTSDLNKTHAMLRPDDRDRILKDTEQNNFNGRMVLPISLNDPIHLLINIQKALEYEKAGNTATWIGTLAHEFTHAIDYYQMARLERLDVYLPLEKAGKYTFFQMWSEYHARKLGYYYLRRYREQHGVMRDKETQIQHIIKFEAPTQAAQFKGMWEKVSPSQRLYNTMQDLGRYSVWMDIFPDVFGRTYFLKTYGAAWAWDILLFLRDHETLESIYGVFDEFKEVLSETWTCE